MCLPRRFRPAFGWFELTVELHFQLSEKALGAERPPDAFGTAQGPLHRFHVLAVRHLAQQRSDLAKALGGRRDISQELR